MGIGNIPMGGIYMYETAERLFLEGKSLRSISEITGINRKKLSLLFKARGLEIKSRGITTGKGKYTHNTNAFKSIETEEQAYWLGFLYADGYIGLERGSVDLTIAEKDMEHLEKFRDFISPSKPLKRRIINKQYIAYRCDVSSREIVNDLISKGCFPNKSLSLEFPTEEQVPKHLVHHFIRGYFDGDGSSHWFYDPRDNSKPQANVEIIGTKEFLDIMSLVLLEQDIPLRNKYYEQGQAYSYRFGGNGLYKKFTDFLYKDATIYLERKLLL